MDSEEEQDAIPQDLYEDADEAEEVDDRKHALLLDAVSSLDGGKANKLSQRTVPTSQISEFNFSSGGGKVRMHELVGSLKHTTSHGMLKKHLQAIQKGKKTVSVPLPRHEKQKIERSVGYEKTKEELKKWNSIVAKNRASEQLVFPLNQPDVRVHTTDQFVKRFQPRTPLEMEVAKLLHGNDNVLTSDTVLTRAEERALKAMSLEEAKERRAELQKHRALLSYKEAKAKRQKKIKSKKFHKILKKEKLKDEKKSLEELQKTDPEGYSEKIMSIERQRIQERISLKHRGGSKFARKQMIYSKYDDKARQDVQDMLQKSRELTQKTVVESDSEEENYSDHGDKDIISEDKSSSFVIEKNPWMSAPKVLQSSGFHKLQPIVNKEAEMDRSDDSEESELPCKTDVIVTSASQNILASQAKEHVVPCEEADSGGGDSDLDIRESDDNQIEEIFSKKSEEKPLQTEDCTVKKKSLSVKNKTKNSEGKNKLKNKNITRTENIKLKSKCDENGSSDDGSDIEEDDIDISLIAESTTRRNTMENLEGDWSDNENISNSIRASKNINTENSNTAKTPTKEIHVDPEKLFTMDSSLSRTQVPEMVSDEEDDPETQQRLTIAQAFASDDVIEEFKQEKNDAVEKGKPKDIDLTLPGWGQWAGTGIKPSKRKNKRMIIKAAPAKPRKDRLLGNVIINEKKDDAIRKHQVSVLPHPYTSVDQFQQSIRAPVGKNWNTETAFKKFIEPKIVTQMGTVIEPIDKSTLLEHEERLQKRRGESNLPERTGEIKKKRFDSSKKFSSHSRNKGKSNQSRAKKLNGVSRKKIKH